MAVMKPRNRLFLIRLTQEEYDALRRLSVDRGARSLSDFARSMLLTSVSKGETGEPLEEVCRALSGLQEAVGRMAERIEEISQTRSRLREAKEA